MLKRYRLGFDPWGLLLFFLIMIPNFIWFAVPAPNDILRADSVTPVLDAVASVCQVLMIAMLCVLLNREREKLRLTRLIAAVVLCVLLYFASWFFYYNGITNAVVVLGLTVPPCLAFLLFAINRKNVPAVIPTLVFTVCHLIYAICNYIV